MIGRSFQDIYVAACGEPFDTRKQGVEHERRCGECQYQISIQEDEAMACQTCDHTMQKVNDGKPPTFWCPRCGTIKSEGSVPEFEEPKLVERAKKLAQADEDADPRGHDLVRLAVAESVGLKL